MSEQRQVPTVEELKRAYEEGIPQTLISGIEVQMRPVQPDKLLRSGRIPDILTPLVVKSLYADARKELDDFVFSPREKADEALEMIQGVDAVCEQALVDPSIVPYLSLADRMWIFRLAFMPAEVLSRFRLGQARDVEAETNEQGDVQQAESADVH